MPATQVMILGAVKTIKPIGACLWLPWVPEDIFSYRYQTVSTVYFILGILTTDLWSQGSVWFHVVKKVRYSDLFNGGINDP